MLSTVVHSMQIRAIGSYKIVLLELHKKINDWYVIQKRWRITCALWQVTTVTRKI